MRTGAPVTTGNRPGEVGSISQALASPLGSSVIVGGVYLGWEGPCAGAPPTRSAWQLAESASAGAACTYVDGPAVPGVSPSTGAAKPIPVRIQAIVREEGGKRYLEADKVDRL